MTQDSVARDGYRRHRNHIHGVFFRARALTAVVFLGENHRIAVFCDQALCSHNLAEHAVCDSGNLNSVAVPCVCAGTAVVRFGRGRHRNLAACAECVCLRCDLHLRDPRIVHHHHGVAAVGRAAGRVHRHLRIVVLRGHARKHCRVLAARGSLYLLARCAVLIAVPLVGHVVGHVAANIGYVCHLAAVAHRVSTGRHNQRDRVVHIDKVFVAHRAAARAVAGGYHLEAVRVVAVADALRVGR